MALHDALDQRQPEADPLLARGHQGLEEAGAHGSVDARAAVGIEEACERARAARDLGVDAIFVEAPESIEELEAIADAVPDAVRVANMIEAGKTPLLTPAELHDLGYDLIVSPLTGLFAATKAMIDAYGTLKDHGTLRDYLDLVVTFDDFGRVIDLDRHYELEQRYAGDAP